MDSDLHVPGGSTPGQIQSDIHFHEILLELNDPMDPTQSQAAAFHRGEIVRLQQQLAQVSQPSGSDNASETRKRPRAFSINENEEYRGDEQPTPNPAVWLGPEASNKRQRPVAAAEALGAGMVYLEDNPLDLLEQQPYAPAFQQLPFRPLPQLADPVDPFPELVHALQTQPVQRPQPADAFANNFLNEDALAEFLITPTPAGGGYAFNQNGYLNPVMDEVQNRNRVLEYELFGEYDATPSPGADAHVVEALIESIKGQDDEESREPTPKAMSSTLMEHQKCALAWLLNMEKGKNQGSILADEMGLGKTVEALSLILANPSSNPAMKTTLIVAPVALMRQWEKELERHVRPTHRLKVYLYHNHNKRVDFNTLRTYDVVLTTYGTLANEYKRIELWAESLSSHVEGLDFNEKRSRKDKLGLLGSECYWYRVILDEAQCIKNRNTLTSKAAAQLQSQYRLCMTGTPMQNSVEDLFPLVRFLRISMYQDWPKFNSYLAKPIKTASAASRDRAMARVQAVLKSVALRRGKTTIIDNKPICDLPPKHTHQQTVEFSDAELELYKAVESKSQLKFNRYLRKGTVSNNYANILVMLLRLRQICCHPHLIKDLGVQVSTDGIPEDDLKSRAATLDADVVRRLQDAEGFECPICFESEINPTILIPCGHTCCGECFQKLIDPARAAQEGNNNGARCPQCRGELSSQKITDFRHFCKVFCPEKFEALRRGIEGDSPGLYDELNERANEDDDESDDSDDDEDVDDGDPTLGGFIVDDEESEHDVRGGNRAHFFPNNDEAMLDAVPAEHEAPRRKPTEKKKVTLAQLKQQSLRSRTAKKKYLKRLRKDFTSSAKIDKTMELLGEIQANDPTEKTLIFSQFTTLLDLLEVPLSRKKFRYQRYDGSMRFEDRVEAVNQFMDSATENIMLISLKAGNAGLNLNKASQVIILDPFWNPFVEDQAVDRAHRMPQKREVHVHRLLVPETVEDRICALQDKKRDIINTALDERAGKSLTKLTIHELRSLFGL